MTLKERTFKMVMATLLSIYAANLLQLEHALAAGIIAILSLLDTKRASFITAFKRIASTVTAFAIASVVFYYMGFTVTAFGVYLVFYVPIAYRFDLQSGIAPCSVLVTHFIGAQSTGLAWQYNGFMLMFLGAAAALLLNLWMPSYKSELVREKALIDYYLRSTLRSISRRLSGEELEKGLAEEIREAEDQLRITKQKALNEYDNQLFSKNDYHVRYLQMREQQFMLVKKMIRSLRNIELKTSQASILAELFQETADQLSEKNTGLTLLESIRNLYKQFRTSPLPETREEFESRAFLFQLLHDIEDLIELKRSFFVEEEKDKKSDELASH